MDNDFEVNGRKFKLNKIDVMKQFHVARKISPLLGSALPAMKEMAALSKNGGFDKLGEGDKLEKISKVMIPFIEGIGKLSDEDSEMVLTSLLSSTEVYQDEHKVWAPVAKGKIILMQDLELPTLLQVAGRSFMYNLSGFFQGPRL